MVIREILKKGSLILETNGIEDSFNEALILFTYAAEESRTYIHTHMDEAVKEGAESLFWEFIEKRSKSMPVSYIVGKAWFMSMELTVNEATLIPRPETEELVEEVLKIASDIQKDEIYMLDICTGSGCIGLAAAFHDKRIRVLLSDINPKCVETAELNMTEYGLNGRVSAVVSNLFEGIPTVKYDIITANPPYIPSADIEKLDPDVKDHEPLAALDGGEDGLGFYRSISKEAVSYLSENGRLVLEIGIGQEEDVKNILLNNSYNNVLVREDFAKIPRIIIATKGCK